MDDQARLPVYVAYDPGVQRTQAKAPGRDLAKPGRQHRSVVSPLLSTATSTPARGTVTGRQDRSVAFAWIDFDTHWSLLGVCSLERQATACMTCTGCVGAGTQHVLLLPQHQRALHRKARKCAAGPAQPSTQPS